MKNYAVFGHVNEEEHVAFIRAASKKQLLAFTKEMFGGQFIVEYIETLGY